MKKPAGRERGIADPDEADLLQIRAGAGYLRIEGPHGRAGCPIRRLAESSSERTPIPEIAQ
jgi:hypothetical protein